VHPAVFIGRPAAIKLHSVPQPTEPVAAAIRGPNPSPAREIVMGYRFADIMFTPSVQALQQEHGSRAQYARMQPPSARPAGRTCSTAAGRAAS
jgi:hypothetical protein